MSKSNGIFNKCDEKTVSLFNSLLTIKEQDAGEYKNIKLSALLKFDIRQFEVNEFGNICIMKYDIGIMKMLTVVLTPKLKDLPLLSLDLMIIGGKRKIYIEFYDLTDNMDDEYTKWLEKYKAIIGRYENIPSFSPSDNWYANLLSAKTYKEFKKDSDEEVMKLYEEILREYIAQIKDYPLMDSEVKTAKLKRIKEYSDRLIDEGGPATNVFKKKIGPDKTRDFFDKVFFATK